MRTTLVDHTFIPFVCFISAYAALMDNDTGLPDKTKGCGDFRRIRLEAGVKEVSMKRIQRRKLALFRTYTGFITDAWAWSINWSSFSIFFRAVEGSIWR